MYDDNMTRKELLDTLCEEYGEDFDEIKYKRTETLRNLLREVCDDATSDLYPNGRDYDAEDEDFW